MLRVGCAKEPVSMAWVCLAIGIAGLAFWLTGGVSLANL